MAGYTPAMVLDTGPGTLGDHNRMKQQTKHIVIAEELFNLIKFYCFIKNKKVRPYVESKLNTKELQNFSSKIKDIKKLK